MFNYRNRVDRLIASMPNNMDGVLLSEPYSMRYYTGFSGGEGYVYVPGTESGQAVVFTDFRYTEQAALECPDSSIVEIRGGRRGLETIWQHISGQGRLQCLGMEEQHLTVAVYMLLQEIMEHVLFVSASKIALIQRGVKEPEEIERIARAEAIGDAAFSHILSYIKAGMTEAEVAIELENYMKKQGASGLSFDTIVASGENSSMPHAGVSNRVLREGDLVTMDFGCIYEGYCSDMTRTVAVGAVDDKKKRVYDTVLAAQRLALEAIRPGAICGEIDKIARDYIYKAGYEGCFGHSLGHSVGLYIHEEPRFAAGVADVLMPGMVITVEPGIYLAGEFGVRIEDVIVVTEDGCRNLTQSTKTLQTI